ncbi:CRAL/TRIO domain-containing protein [Auricularia subglabra TFB-10046 SS5]|nr:CRAL/TRIO domain-containing protein [Auricularia subglabra TFB-10046 SS5]
MASAESGSENYTALDAELSGQLGHLSESQEAALTAFKELVAQAGIYRPAVATTDDKPAALPSHDDITLLRFLRGKGFDPTKAAAQFTQSEEWRKTNDVGKIYASTAPEDLSHTRLFFPRWTGHRDKMGRPLYVWSLKTVAPRTRELTDLTPQRRLEKMISLYENLRLFTMRLCSCLPSASSPTPISSTSNIIDLDGVSLSLIWTLRSHLQASAGMASTNYPEFITRVFVVNAPYFFPKVWDWVKGFFDEGTRNKVYVLGTEPGPELLKHVDAADLPKIYGGELDWSLIDPPKLDESARALLQRDEFPDGPFVFVADGPTTGRMVDFDPANPSLEFQRDFIGARKELPKEESQETINGVHANGVNGVEH